MTMDTHLKAASNHLFGDDGLRASNFKLFPGHNRAATPEQVAQEIDASLSRMEKGEFDEVEQFKD